MAQTDSVGVRGFGRRIGGIGAAARALDWSTEWTRQRAKAGDIPVAGRLVNGQMLFDLDELERCKTQREARKHQP